jgi:hypothetical protein
MNAPDTDGADALGTTQTEAVHASEEFGFTAE